MRKLRPRQSDGMKFCCECGTLLKNRCPQCGFENPQSAFHNPQLETEECFLKTIEVAQRQQAKSLELRATMSLVRLRQQQATQQGSRNTKLATRTLLDTAHNTLSEIYNWFTEGFDTPDLKDAKALLAELGDPGRQIPSKRQPRRRKEQ